MCVCMCVCFTFIMMCPAFFWPQYEGGLRPTINSHLNKNCTIPIMMFPRWPSGTYPLRIIAKLLNINLFIFYKRNVNLQ